MDPQTQHTPSQRLLRVQVSSASQPHEIKKYLAPHIPQMLAQLTTRELEKSLKSALKARAPYVKLVDTLRERYLADILSERPSKQQEVALWRNCVYRPMEVVKSLSRTSAKHLQEYQAVLHGHISMYSHIYESTLGKVDTTHRTLVCLGDLTRYLQLSLPEDQRCWTGCAEKYTAAIQLRPENGTPHNQLAVVCTYRGDTFTALYHYLRSMYASESAFSADSSNLALLYEQNQELFETAFGFPVDSAITHRRQILPLVEARDIPKLQVLVVTWFQHAHSMSPVQFLLYKAISSCLKPTLGALITYNDFSMLSDLYLKLLIVFTSALEYHQTCPGAIQLIDTLLTELLEFLNHFTNSLVFQKLQDLGCTYPLYAPISVGCDWILQHSELLPRLSEEFKFNLTKSLSRFTLFPEVTNSSLPEEVDLRGFTLLKGMYDNISSAHTMKDRDQTLQLRVRKLALLNSHIHSSPKSQHFEEEVRAEESNESPGTISFLPPPTIQKISNKSPGLWVPLGSCHISPGHPEIITRNPFA